MSERKGEKGSQREREKTAKIHPKRDKIGLCVRVHNALCVKRATGSQRDASISCDAA